RTHTLSLHDALPISGWITIGLVIANEHRARSDHEAVDLAVDDRGMPVSGEATHNRHFGMTAGQKELGKTIVSEHTLHFSENALPDRKSTRLNSSHVA